MLTIFVYLLVGVTWLSPAMVTGFDNGLLLAGIGNVDEKGEKNFMIVDNKVRHPLFPPPRPSFFPLR